MRLGLIGLGRIGAFHADTLSHLEGVDSLVVTDAVPAVTASVAERFGAEAADSPAALISSGVDGIVIAAATDAHTALIRAGVPAVLGNQFSVTDDGAITFAKTFYARIVQGWCAIIALIGIAERFWNHDHRWRKTLTEAVFPFYIIHQTVIVGVEWVLLGQNLAPAAEFAILVVATIAGCWAFYLLGREISWLRPLIGLRARAARPGPATVLAPQA